jgi:thiol-disulfide isomerase/thioredoxin
MDRRVHRVLSGLLFAGGLLMGAPGVPLYAAAVVNDPFAALRVTRVVPGSPLASFDLKNLEGETVRSKELAGKVVLLNFWATWCGPCKEEMPSLAKLQSRFDPARFQVVTVTTDMHPKGIKQFLDHLGIRLPVHQLRSRRYEMKRWLTVAAVGMVLLYTAFALGAAGCVFMPKAEPAHAHHAPSHAEHSPFCTWACQANSTESIHAAAPVLGIFLLVAIQRFIRVSPHTFLLASVSRARAPPL